VPEGDAGRQMLEGLLHKQLSQGPIGTTARDEFPLTASFHDVGKGIIGGIRDEAQDMINTPVDIFNTITGFVSNEPPGKPAELGSRQRLIPEIQAQQLPDVGEPENRTEYISRLLSRIVADMVPIGSVAAKATKGIRAARKALQLNPLQRRMLHAMYGATDVRHLNRGKLVRLLEDLGDLKRTNPDVIVDTNLEAVRRAARRRLDKLDGVDTRYLEDIADDLQDAARSAENIAETTNTLSESARRISRVFDLPFKPQDFAKMTHEQALQAQKRLLSRARCRH
jgi:hypothetical protein